jgi:UDP-2,3-diacylglucosamine pyrophosphatase LpxH
LRPGSDLVFVGDVHLDRDDPDLPPFLAYLRGLAPRAGRIVLMGDLFNLWIGAPELEQEHHRAVIACLAELRSGGTEIHYLEGNRDYRIARTQRGGAFDAVGEVGLREDWGGRSLWAEHGDLVNWNDIQYRAWRRFSRSTPAWWLFSAIPRARRFAIAESVEKRMRATNVDMKREFPEALIRANAARHLGSPGAAVVLGHFHVEKELRGGPAGEGRVFVLPAWKGSRRHLRVTSTGDARFENA